jgi:PAS domain S-box-containing protein
MLEWASQFSLYTVAVLYNGFVGGGWSELREWYYPLLLPGSELAQATVLGDLKVGFNQLFAWKPFDLGLIISSYLEALPQAFDTAQSDERLPFYLKSWFIVASLSFLVGLGFLIYIFVRQLRNLADLQAEMDRWNKDREIAEQQFKSVWSNSQDGMLLTLEGNEILTVNPAFAKIMNSRVEELEGKCVDRLFNRESFRDFFLDVLLHQVRETPGQGISLEMQIEWKTGPLDMEVYSVMLDQDHHGKTLELSVFRDVTAQKSVQNKLREAKEKAEQANLFKTSLLSNITHEIRTPLNGIIGGAEHIKMSRKDDPELQSQLNLILQSGERLLGTINSLLDIAKTEAKKMPVLYTQTEIREFLEAVIRPLQAVSARKGLTFNFKFLSPDFSAKVDRRFLEMILNNLISNSTKYTVEGSITVTCEKVDGRLVLEVSDTGVGISKDFQTKMFDPFEQESKGHNRLFEGTGLGLSITRNLVHLMGGKIEIWSIKNEGTRVLVEIPLFET